MDKEFKGGKTDIDGDYIEMLIHNFSDALNSNDDKVYLGYEVIDDDNLKEYAVSRKDWKSTLEILLKTAINLEEYEYCSQIKEIINSLN